ncbi:MAG: OmpA family protein [Desulfobacula sp.]|jgi:peptidoglycan-associated lipoprotein|nr:OmpA family protein [Desulfobacula sp.]
MKKNIGFNLLLVVLVAALMATMSCANKTSVSESLAVTSAIAEEEAARKRAELEREKERKIREAELAREKNRKEAAARALYKFENDNILFAFDSYELSLDAQKLLRYKAAYLKNNPYTSSATIEGHCDERGTIEYNLALGEKRALAVKTFLTNLGIASNRIFTISYGEEKPLNSSNNEAAYAVNRRAQFILKR